MKQLVFSLAFMLIGLFAFASNIEVKQEVREVIEIVDFEKTSIKNVIVQQITSDWDWDCIEFNDSCGGTWIVCYKNVTTIQLSLFLWARDGGC